MKRTKLQVLETCSTAIIQILGQLKSIEDQEDAEETPSKKAVVRENLDGMFEDIARDIKRQKSSPRTTAAAPLEDEEHGTNEDSDDDAAGDIDVEDDPETWRLRYESRRPIRDCELSMLSAHVDAAVAEFHKLSADKKKSTVKEQITRMIQKCMRRHGNVGPDFSKSSRRNYKSFADVEFVHIVAAYFLAFPDYAALCKSSYSRIGALKNAINRFDIEFKERSPLSRAFEPAEAASDPVTPSKVFGEFVEKIKVAILYVEMEAQKQQGE